MVLVDNKQLLVVASVGLGGYLTAFAPSLTRRLWNCIRKLVCVVAESDPLPILRPKAEADSASAHAAASNAGCPMVAAAPATCVPQVCEALYHWLEGQGLAMYGATMASLGYDDLDFLGDLSTTEVDDMIAYLKPLPGHAVKFRRRLAQLRTAIRVTSEEVSTSVSNLDRPEMVQEQTALLEVTGTVVDKAVEVSNDSCQAPAMAGNSACAIGSRAELHGLTKRPELNGKTGTLTAWDSATGRWEFTPDGSQGGVKVRPDFVRPCSEAQPLGLQASSQPRRTEQTLGAPSSSSQSPQVPDEFRCCITQDIMERPVFTSDGHTYERSAIARWLEEHMTSPRTGQQLPDVVLRPNHALRAQIMAWRERMQLSPLPPWDPEPQETIRQQIPQVQQQGNLFFRGGVPPLGQHTLVVRSVGGTLQMPIVAGQQMTLPMIPALRDELLAAWREGNVGNPEEPSNESLLQSAAHSPRLAEVLARWMGQQVEPDGRLPFFIPPALESPLFRAAREGECGVVERLLGPFEPGRQQWEVAPTGDTLLHLASWFGHTRLAAMLLARGHPVDVPSRNRSTPLHYAAFRGHLDVADLLLQAQAELGRRMVGGDTPLHQAAGHSQTAMFRRLLERRADATAVMDNGDSALALTAFQGNREACQILLSHTPPGEVRGGVASRNQLGRTVLHLAAAGGAGSDIVRLLVDASVPVNAVADNGETALHLAVQSGAHDTMVALLEARAEVDPQRFEDETTPLTMAIWHGRPNSVRALLEARASLDACRRRDGMTPVHVAALHAMGTAQGDGETLSFVALAQARADFNVGSRTGMGPLHIVLARPSDTAPRRNVALRALLDARADLNSAWHQVGRPLGDVMRPLHMAIVGNLRAEVVTLLEYRADVHAAGVNGETALHVAARCGFGECIELLLRAGSDPTRRDNSGLTCTEVARLRGFPQIEHILECGVTGLANDGATGATVGTSQGQTTGSIGSTQSPVQSIQTNGATK